MGYWTSIAFGLIGAVVPDLLRLVSLRKQETPFFVTKGVVWTSVIASIWVGIAAVTALPSGRSLLEAVAIGYAAPQFLSKVLSERNAPEQPLGAYLLGIPAIWRIQRWWAL